MTYHVKINEQNVVVGVSTAAPLELFVGETAIDSDEPVVFGQIYNASTETFSDAPPPLPTKTDLMIYANRKHVALRDGGITVNVGTKSQSTILKVDTNIAGMTDVGANVTMLSVASQLGEQEPTFSWNDGVESPSISLSAAQMLRVSWAQNSYRQATYATLAVVKKAVTDGKITTFAQVDDPTTASMAPWPTTQY